MGYREKYYRLLEKIREYVEDYYGERLITLAVFGSTASDAFRPDPDIDILLVVKGLPQGRIKRVSELVDNIESKLIEEFKALYREDIYPHLRKEARFFLT